MTDSIKIVVMGSGGVGKSALTVQFVQNIFVQRYDPTIEDSYRKRVEIGGTIRKLEILDTAGTEEMAMSRRESIRKADGFILVYSVISRTSFSELNEYHDEICRIRGATDFPIVLCGNKCDLLDDRIVEEEDGKLKAKMWKAHFLEASARTRVNCQKVFKVLCQEVIDRDSVDSEVSAGCCKKCVLL